MWQRIENILVNNEAWPYEKEYDKQGYLWGDEKSEEDEEGDEEEW